MPITKIQIENAIRKKMNFSKDDFRLSKAEGSWYWSGSKVADFDECCTFNTTLDTISLEQWVKNFEFDYKHTERRI
jgi:hypothetical protein